MGKELKPLHLNLIIMGIKKIILSAVCIMLSASVNAQKSACFEQLDSVEVTMSAFNRDVLFGLSKSGKEILPAEYEMELCRELGLIAFYSGRDLFLYDTDGELILAQELDFEVDHRSTVSFEQIRDRNDQSYYELVVYYFDCDWGAQVIGAFSQRRGHLYKVKITKEFFLIK